MTPNEYQEAALRTEPPNSNRIFHSAMGCCTESGELMDILKKTHFYKQPVDYVNFKEELGDLLWYIAIGAQGCGTTMEILMQNNIDKLKRRYPEKFTEEHAKARLDKA